MQQGTICALIETVEEYGVYDRESGELPKLPKS
jgi:hypothetical protein